MRKPVGARPVVGSGGSSPRAAAGLLLVIVYILFTVVFLYYFEFIMFLIKFKESFSGSRLNKILMDMMLNDEL